jgi:CubicO group peptidase (beta-lactamase class C family)
MFKRFNNLFEQGCSEIKHLGGQLYVSLKGKVVFDGALGKDLEGKGIQPDHKFPWLSSGKPITAAAIGRLLDEKQLRLDWPVKKVIPEFTSQKKDSILISNLLTHTACMRGADKIPDNLDWQQTIAEICKVDVEPQCNIGETAGYHVSGTWFLLGEIVARVSSVPFPTFLDTHIFKPANMARTTLGMSHETYLAEAKAMASMYVSSSGDMTSNALLNSEAFITSVRPGSNIRGPISDLGRFYENLVGLNGTPIMREGTIRQFTTRQRIGMMDQTFKRKLDWGYGFIINSAHQVEGEMPYGYGKHATRNTYGHSGAQSSTGFCDPDHELVIAWVMNGMCGELQHSRRAHAFNTALYEDLGLDPKTPIIPEKTI